jgi:hypothetical protein
MSDLIIDYYKNPGTSSMDTSNNHMPYSNITSELDKVVDSDKVSLTSNQLNMASTATSKSIFEAVILNIYIYIITCLVTSLFVYFM